MGFRILQIGKYYPPDVGGMESHLHVLCEELSKHNAIDVEVLVASTNRGSGCSSSAPKVSRSRSILNLAGAPLCPGMVAKIAFSRADIVHIHLPNPGAMLACLASGFRGPLIASWHSDVVRQKKLLRLFGPFQRRFLSFCDAIVVASEKYLESSEQLRQWAHKCRVIPYGIRAADFDDVDSRRVQLIRKELGPRIVLAAGRLVYYKGLEYALRAMREVDATLVIAGDGPNSNELRRLASELGVLHRVAFAGQVEDMRPYYHAADVFVLPSVARSEAFGIVQLEAMACGKPVVNTSLPTGVPGVSLDGLTGFTVAPANSEALAGALNLLLGDSELRRRFGEAARKRVKALFSADRMCERMMELYCGLLPRPALANAHRE